MRLGAGLIGVGLLGVGTLLMRLSPDQWQVGELCRGLAAAVVGIPTLASGLRGVVTGDTRRATDQLVAIAILAAAASGSFVTATLIPLFLELGRLFEERSSLGARAAIDGIRALAARQASKWSNNVEQRVDPDSLRPGDQILVRPGERIAVVPPFRPDGLFPESRLHLAGGPGRGEVDPSRQHGVGAEMEMRIDEADGERASGVGEPVRLVTMDLAKKDEERAPQVFINPQITWASDEMNVHEEGCLSIPDIFGDVERAESVVLEAREHEAVDVSDDIQRPWPAQRAFQVHAAGEGHASLKAAFQISQQDGGEIEAFEPHLDVGGEIAAQVGVHPVQLARAFRKRYRCSVGELQRRLRLEHASRQLVTTHRTLAEIALAAGFSDQAHFCRVFKAHTGLTPARFRTTFATH